MATPLNHSVIKAFTVLKAFRDPGEWLTGAELSRRSNLPGASAYRLIQTLEEIGAVVRGPRGRYRPGMLLVSLSQNVAVPELLEEAGQAIAAELSERLDATVHVGVLDREMVTYVIKSETPRSAAVPTRTGCQLEAYCTALGKVLLAALAPEQLDAVIRDGGLVPLTPNTITGEKQLRAHLEMVRTLGFAVDNGEFRPDLRCVAVPVRDDQGRAVAAISVSETAAVATPQRCAQLRGELLAAAEAIGRKICPSGPRLNADAPPEHRDLEGAKQGLGEAA